MKYRVLSAVMIAAMSLSLMGLDNCQGNSHEDLVDLTIFHTNDLHSHLKPVNINPFGLGGMARLSTLLKKLRKEKENSVTLDAGDWSEGTWYYNLDIGANMLQFLQALRYDATCLGNHDFLNGPDQVIKTVTDAGVSMPVLAANLEMSNFPRAKEFREKLPSYYIKDVNGLKVGIIGLTTFEIFYSSYMAPVVIKNPIDVASEIAKAIRPDVDFVILVSHNAFEANMQMARSVTGVDAVISGHSHKKVPKAITVRNAGRDIPVVETGQWGEFLGELTLTLDKSNHQVKMKDYRLHAVTQDIAEDPAIVEMIADQDQKLKDLVGADIHETVGHVDFEARIHDSGESPMANLIARANRVATGADVALEMMSTAGIGLGEGPISLIGAHDVAPHIYNVKTGKNWTLKVWNARGLDLWTVVTAFYTVAGMMPLSNSQGWLATDNVEIRWTPTEDPPKIEQIKIGGNVLDIGARYRVVITDALLQGIATFKDKFGLPLDLSDVHETGIEESSSMISYIRSFDHLKIEDLKVGLSVRTDPPDLSVYYYNLKWDGSNVSVKVENHGLLPSGADAQVVCSSGIPNDFVSYATPEQKWTEFGRANVPALAPGAEIQLSFPWSSVGKEAGYWPVQCEVVYGSDGYVGNNLADQVFKVTPPPGH